MSSTASSTGNGRRYRALPPPKQQKTFAATSTRRTARPTAKLPGFGKKQSSLTQMQWTGTPRQTVDVLSDEDDEWEERPAKRQKTSASKGKQGKFEKREAGQSSFTQVDYLGRMKRPPRSDVDEEGFQVWHDSDTEPDYASSPTREIDSTARTIDSENAAPEIAESSQGIVNSEHDANLRVPRAQKPATKPRTPQKVRFVEVLSSQTPPSSKASAIKADLRRRSLSRSPLKGRSVNIRTSPDKLESPQSQNMSMKMLENVRQRERARREKSASNKQLDDDLQRCAAEATDEFSIRTYPMPPPPRRHLERKTTVQDSQPESILASRGSPELESPKFGRTTTIEDSQRNSSNETLVEDSQLQRPLRRLRRVATIQDSQCSDSEDGLNDDEVHVSQHNENGTTQNDNQNDTWQHHPFSEGTYDPAFSALDRDASRFQWTQTQRRLSEVAEDTEAEDEDLDRGCSSRSSPQHEDSQADPTHVHVEEASAAASNEVSNRRYGTQRNASDEIAINTVAAGADPRADSAYDLSDGARTAKTAEVPSSPPPLTTARAVGQSVDNNKDEDERVPSSPPPLRPSQVSTVVPTQASIAMRAPSPPRHIKGEPLSQFPSPRHQQPAFSFVSSPQKPSSVWQADSLSSSPLPLPPCTSPEKHRLVHDTHERGEGSFELGSDAPLDSLADFSLPPPPPLSSSRRQTPASSSL